MPGGRDHYGVSLEGGPQLLDEAGDGDGHPVGVAVGAQLPQPVFLRPLDVLEVRGAGVVSLGRPLAHLRDELLQHAAGVAHQAHRRRVVLADLAGVDVGVDQLRGRDGEADPVAERRRRLVREAAAHRQQDVGAAGKVVAAGRPLGARVPAVQRMILRKRALPRERGDHRRPQVLRQLAQRPRRLGGQHAATGQDHRPLRRHQ